MSKYDGGPAFPETGERGKAAGGEGMSLRDYFAAKALQGMLSNLKADVGVGQDEANEAIAAAAYAIADAMLNEGTK